MVASIFVFMAVDHTKGFVKTEAVVSQMVLYEEAYTDSEENDQPATYRIFVKYTVDGTEYENELGILTGYKIGTKITICYNPSNPNEISQPNNLVLPIAILVAGLASFVGGIVSIVVAVKKHKTLKAQEKEWETNGN